MDSRLTIAKREWASLRREKTIVLALIIQLLVASFSSFVVFGVVSVFSPDAAGQGTTVEFGIVGEDSQQLSEIVQDTSGAEGVIYESFEEAYTDYQNGEIQAMIFSQKQDNGRLQVRLYAPDTGVISTVVVVRGKEILKKYQDAKRNELSSRLQYTPLDTSSQGGGNSEFFSFTYILLIPILVFLPAFISGSLSSDSITEGIAEGTIHILQSAPVDDEGIIQAKMIGMAILAPLQTLLWMVLLSLNGIQVHNIIPISIVTLSISLVVSSLGSIIALKYRDRSKAQFIYSTSIVTLFAVLSVLPESPINMVAKLSIGSASLITYGMVGVYLLLGILSSIGVVIYVRENGIPSVTGHN